MDVKVYPSEVSGKARAPPSKSYSHRAVLTAAMAKGSSRIENPLLSEDVNSSIDAARAFGASVDLVDGDLSVEGFGGTPKTPQDIVDVGNSGTTLRFCIGLAGLVGEAAVLTGDGSLRGRPNGPLLKAVNRLGAEAFSTKGDGTAPVVVRGGMEGGSVEMDGSVSSQFFSSLLLAGQGCRKPCTAEVEGELRSRPYVEMTVDLIRRAGGDVETRGSSFVSRPSELEHFEYSVPGDYSSASYLLALGALSGGIRVEGLSDTRQGDRVFVDVLEDMGASVEKGSSWVEISPGKLKGVEVDCGDTPDLVPTIAVVGSLAEGTTRIVNVGHLRFKETNRLSVTAQELSKMGAEVEAGQDYLAVEGGELEGAELDGAGDHRMVMALTVAALCASSPSVVKGADCTEVSFPGFFEVVEGLGGGVQGA